MSDARERAERTVQQMGSMWAYDDMGSFERSVVDVLAAAIEHAEWAGPQGPMAPTEERLVAAVAALDGEVG